MADGVFLGSQGGFSDAYRDVLSAKYAQAAAQAQAVREDQKMRADVLGRLTLTAGGQPVSPNAYLSSIYGTVPPGLQAAPTTFATGAARDTTQQNIAGQKSADELKKQGVTLRQHWAGMLKPGEVKKASDFNLPPEMLKQFFIDPGERISSSQKPPSAGGKGGSSKDTGIKATDVQRLLANVRTQYKDANIFSQHFGNAARLPAVQQTLQEIETGVTGGKIKTADDVDNAIIASVKSGTITGDEARTLRAQFHGGK